MRSLWQPRLAQAFEDMFGVAFVPVQHGATPKGRPVLQPATGEDRRILFRPTKESSQFGSGFNKAARLSATGRHRSTTPKVIEVLQG
jgi:hypothetical protein